MSDLCDGGCTCNGFRAPELFCAAFKSTLKKQAVDIHGPIESHPDLDPTKPLPHEQRPKIAADLLAKIEALEPHERLQLASELLAAKQPRMALAIARRVVTDLEILAEMGLF